MVQKPPALQTVEKRILILRGHKVMLDKDLAELYEVPTKRLNEQVKRNKQRFPEDFMFQLTDKEYEMIEFSKSDLRSQIATSKRGGRRYLPYAFTEQGVAMLSSVLNSERAIQVNIAIMRTFVQLRNTLVVHKEFAGKLRELERKLGKHDAEIQAIFKVLHQLMTPPKKPKERIGFQTPRK